MCGLYKVDGEIYENILDKNIMCICGYLKINVLSWIFKFGVGMF